ncbi:hypothetical protein STRDD10_00984 [Streptococcus sp. DD10]|uniref:DUF3021 domain-containing protein n=1 Tax=Streptococcus sp. DD10 TaxID=1777878 RepID=UPI00079A91B8|nr:hypothetical protein STRDD10_00984 [Streptococcus sp. DD10]
MKRYFTSGMSGILIGLVISIGVSFFVAPSYMPLNPYSAIGIWMREHHIHGSLVLLYCLLIWFAIGLLFEIGNQLFRLDYSPLRATIYHYSVTLLGFIPLAILGGWFPLQLGFILSLILEFSIIYLIVWLIKYFIYKKESMKSIKN